MSTDFSAHFQRKAVEPLACIKGGWNLVRGQYWLFVGIILVAMLLNGVVPFWILLGPTMCGIYLLLLNALLALAGAIFCYVGLFLALPICFGSVSIAYQQVFGLATARSAAPPPPPVFS